MVSPTSAAKAISGPPGPVEAVQIAPFTAADLNRILWLLDRGRYDLSLREHEQAREIVRKLQERRDLMAQIERANTNEGQ